jgi:hypothetical protein
MTARVGRVVWGEEEGKRKASGRQQTWHCVLKPGERMT